MAINPALPKTGVLSELTRRSETDKVRYVYYGLYVQQTCWTERVRNITVICGILRSPEAEHHPKIGQIHTYLGSKSVGIDTKCGTGRCCAGGGYCYAPFGPSGAIWASGLATAAIFASHYHPHRAGGQFHPIWGYFQYEQPKHTGA